MIEEDYNTQGFKCLQGEYINTAAYTVQQVHTMQKKATGNTELLTDKMTDIYPEPSMEPCNTKSSKFHTQYLVRKRKFLCG